MVATTEHPKFLKQILSLFRFVHQNSPIYYPGTVQQPGPYNVKLVTLQINYPIYMKLHVENTPWIVSLVLQSVSARCFVPQVNCLVKDYL